MVHLGSHCINIQISEHSGRIFKDIYLNKMHHRVWKCCHCWSRRCNQNMPDAETDIGEKQSLLNHLSIHVFFQPIIQFNISYLKLQFFSKLICT